MMAALRTLLIAVLVLFVGAAHAQDLPDAADIDAFRTEVEALPEGESRTELQTQLATLQSRTEALEEARRQRELFEEEIERGPERLQELRGTIAELRAAPPPTAPTVDFMNNARLQEFESELAEAETRFTALRTRIGEVDRALQTAAARPVNIISEAEAAQERIARISRQLDTLSASSTDLDTRLRRSALLAARASREAELLALEAERASNTARLERLQLERDLAQLEADRLALRIEGLQSVTGQRLMNEAGELQTRNLMALAGATTAPSRIVSATGVEVHPLIADFAERNAELIESLQALAEADTRLPEQRAQVQSQLASVSSNLNIVTQLTELGGLDRRAGETLRRLRAAVPVQAAVEADIERSRAQYLSAQQDFFLAQEELRNMPYGRMNAERLLSDFQRNNSDAPPLTVEEASWLDELYELRRDALDRITKAANARSASVIALQQLQTDLLDQTVELQTVLDENLLWLPSAEPVWLDWPAKVVRGTLELVQPARLASVLSTLQGRALALWPLSLLAVIAAVGLFTVRPRLRASMKDRGAKVGRVREDSLLHTPLVVLESFALALPLPILVGFTGWLLRSADAAPPIARAVGMGLTALAIFLMIFLTLRAAADRDGLFHRHIRVPEDLRRGIQTETRWFIPTAGTAVFVLALARDSRSTDVYEGVALAAFLALAVAAGLFFYRLLWGRRAAFTRTLESGSFWFRYRKPIIGLLVGLPFATAFAAGLGFLSTADEVLQLVMNTAVVALLLYVVYGILRRSVNITHRRLTLKQALQRREAALEARRKEEAALAEGDASDEAALPASPPPVDYEQIDLEQTSRQTRQLVGTITLIGFLAALWFIWRDLLPALGALDSVELYRNGTTVVGEGDDALEVTQYITLWDLVQSLVTIVLTIIAARNLPGFLEIFVLNRSNLESGVKYAIVTITGYVIIAFGLVTALNQLGVQWGQLGFIVAALGVGIGFGLQEIIANFISGIIILFERPVRVGDYVTVGDQSGNVSRIKIRATTLTDLDNKEILIPNKEFITSRVTNWTLSNSVLRLIIPVGIAYGSDTRKAQKIMLDTLKAEPKVLDTPAPQVIFVNFGDSSLDFELRVFCRSVEDRFPVINAVHTAINLALERAGISIPFPQRDLHLVSAEAPLKVGQPRAQKGAAPKLPEISPEPAE